MGRIDGAGKPRNSAGKREGSGLVESDVIAERPQPVLVFADADQDLAEPRAFQPAKQQVDRRNERLEPVASSQ